MYLRDRLSFVRCRGCGGVWMYLWIGLAFASFCCILCYSIPSLQSVSQPQHQKNHHFSESWQRFIKGNLYRFLLLWLTLDKVNNYVISSVGFLSTFQQIYVFIYVKFYIFSSLHMLHVCNIYTWK